MSEKVSTYKGYSTRSGTTMYVENKNIPHIKRVLYKEQERMSIVWLELENLTVCSDNHDETWFIGGIRANIGKNWITC